VNSVRLELYWRQDLAIGTVSRVSAECIKLDWARLNVPLNTF